MPQRIQRRRMAEWRMPADAVYVGRPTRWGNPFRLGDFFGASRCVTCGDMVPAVRVDSRHRAVRLFEAWLLWGQPFPGVDTPPTREQITDALAARDLACWCPLDAPCHADVLLDVANGYAQPGGEAR